MREQCYFISDLHLGSVEEPNAFVLLKFLRQFHSTDQITHLFLLGDIFDLWVSSQDYYIKKFQPIVLELKRLHALGVKIHYFEGNHDLYLQHYFGDVLGFHIHPGPAYFELCGRRLRIEHGDEMDLKDYGYRALRWFWRTPVMTWLAPRIPAGVVRAIGENMSRASRARTQIYTDEQRTARAQWAHQLLGQHVERVWPDQPFDMLVTGHVHVVDDFSITPAQQGLPVRVLNLGSWFDGPKFFKLTPEGGGFVDIVALSK